MQEKSALRLYDNRPSPVSIVMPGSNCFQSLCKNTRDKSHLIELKWEIIWTGGLPHLPGVPHLHVNSPVWGGLIFGGAYFRNFTVVCFTQCTFFFSLNTFDFYCQFVCRALSEGCNEDKCWQTCSSRVAWLVYVRTYCVPIATLNQNKRSRLL